MSKIINFPDMKEIIRFEAGKIWLIRGGGISTQEQQNLDYSKAERQKTILICRKLSSRDL